MTQVVDIVLISLLMAAAIALVRTRNLFAVAMLFGIFSLLAAAVYVVVDAVDVALTEAAVGAGISTVLMLATIAIVGHHESTRAGPRRPIIAAAVVVLTGGALVWATLDMPRFGDPEAPAQVHVAPRYIQESPQEIGIPNMVASVLASYRGYDTFGEVTVIFTAGVAVLMLIGGVAGQSRRRRSDATRRDDTGQVAAHSAAPTGDDR